MRMMQMPNSRQTRDAVRARLGKTANRERAAAIKQLRPSISERKSFIASLCDHR
jgi:hypothetical protein